MGRKPSRPEVGTITQKHGAWYWRRYATNAAGERKQEWVKLCDVSDERRTKADVIDLVRERIKQEAHIDRPASGSKQIGNFVEDDFLPWVDANKRPATANGYKKIWNKHLKPHFGEMKLADYRPYHATRFLGQLAGKMTGHSVAHIRALMSCIFAHAVADGRVDSNPIRDASLRVEPKASKKTPHYTPAEMLAILKALANHPQGQVAMALGFFAGLRTAEIAGLQWGDIADDWNTIQIQRSVWRGQAADCKTETSKAPIPLIEPLRSLLRDFKQSQTVLAPSQHVLVNSLLRPLDLAGLAHRIIRPVLKERGLEWKGYYAGRRGLATLLANTNPQAAMGMLRHATLNTTQGFYIKQIPSATIEAMNALETSLSEEVRDK